jgi:hypothetical protein
MSPQAARRLLAARWARRVSGAVVVVGSMNLLAGVGLDVRTFIAPVGPGYERAFVPSFVLIFPLGLWSVLLLMALAGGTRRGLKSEVPRRADALGRLPSFLPWTLGAAALVGLVSAVSGASALTGGQPIFVAATGQYTLNNHGSVSIVTRTVYEAALAGMIRWFLCGAILGSCFAVVVALNHWLSPQRPLDPTTSP